MKTSTILGMVSIAVITGIGIYGVSPYFTNTTIDRIYQITLPRLNLLE